MLCMLLSSTEAGCWNNYRKDFNVSTRMSPVEDSMSLDMCKAMSASV